MSGERGKQGTDNEATVPTIPDAWYGVARSGAVAGSGGPKPGARASKLGHSQHGGQEALLPCR